VLVALTCKAGVVPSDVTLRRFVLRGEDAHLRALCREGQKHVIQKWGSSSLIAGSTFQ
jgi:hypothetical protein